MAAQIGPVPARPRLAATPVDLDALADHAPADHLDRDYHELLQEVRVAQSGVQVLLAFLLWVAFSPGVRTVSPGQRWLYVVALVLAALSLALLIAPACTNRIIHRQALRPVAFRLANRCAIGGMGLLFASVSCAMVLILDVVLGAVPATALGTGTVAWFAVWWYILPLVVRHRHTRPTAHPAPTGTGVGGASAGLRSLPVAGSAGRVGRRPVCHWQLTDGGRTARWGVDRDPAGGDA
jgi:hypothetical protein